VAYEFGMFRFLCEKLEFDFRESVTFKPGDVTFLGTGSSTDDDDRTTFALLESMLLHTRVLLDFFYGNRCKDDIIAQDFVPNWNNLRPPLGPYLADDSQHERLNKALAHLTLKRIDYDAGQKSWDVTAISSEIGRVISSFIANLPADRRAWFSDIA